MLGGSGPRALELRGVLREIDAQTWLSPLVREVHRLAVAQKLDEVVLDLRELEYANASLIKCLVEWMRLIRDEGTVRYRVRVRSTNAHRWQKVGIAGVEALAKGLMTVEISERDESR
jgi:hypothetical protein